MKRVLASVTVTHEALLLAYDPAGLVRRIVRNLHRSLSEETVLDYALSVRAEAGCTCFKLVSGVKETEAKTASN